MVTASIILRLRNEVKHVGAVLRALSTQTFTDYEIVVVDSGSTDGTLEAVSAYPITLIQIQPEEFTYGYALNVGAEYARGRYLVSVSGHSIPADEHWLARLVDACSPSWVAASYSRLMAPADGLRHYKLLYPMLYPATASFQNGNNTFHNASSCVKRDVWLHNPFDEVLPACEDFDWARRVRQLGYAIVYEPRSVIYHIHDESIAQYLARTFGRDLPAMAKVWLRKERPPASVAKKPVSISHDR